MDRTSKSVRNSFRMTIAYDGLNYVGWQRQAHGVTVQQRVEEAIEHISQQKITVEGCSRTDTGVHALGMVAGFKASLLRFTPFTLRRAINANLPEDIRVLRIQRVPDTFHARFDVRSKTYRYRILNTPVSDPLRRHVCWFYPHALDVHAMRRAGKQMVGRHDFSALAVNPGYKLKSMVRQILRCSVLRYEDEIHLLVEGDGFLYKMVRTIAGTLMEVGRGKRDANSIADLIRSKKRVSAGLTAPAHGLCLLKVHYKRGTKRGHCLK